MYSDAEMEDVLVPHMMTGEQLDEQFDIEPDCEDPWSEAWMDRKCPIIGRSHSVWVTFEELCFVPAVSGRVSVILSFLLP
jgi:hypothetical protein